MTYDKQEKQERLEDARQGSNNTSTQRERSEARVERAAKGGRS